MNQLDVATDLMNKSIEEIETALAPYGVKAEILYVDEKKKNRFLLFRKHKGKFRIFTGEDNVDNPVEIPLLHASRETRIQAIPFLPKLAAELFARYEEECLKVEEAVAKVEAITKLVRGG